MRGTRFIYPLQVRQLQWGGRVGAQEAVQAVGVVRDGGRQGHCFLFGGKCSLPEKRGGVFVKKYLKVNRGKDRYIWK